MEDVGEIALDTVIGIMALLFLALIKSEYKKRSRFRRKKNHAVAPSRQPRRHAVSQIFIPRRSSSVLPSVPPGETAEPALPMRRSYTFQNFTGKRKRDPLVRNTTWRC